MNGPGAQPRILIVRVGAMGDVLHGMPAVAALRTALPEAHLAWAVEPRWSPLLSSADGSSALVDAVHLVNAKAWSKRPLSMATLRSIRALRHALRRERYDIVIDLQGTLRSAVIARMSGAPRIIGSAEPREWPARLFYTERIQLRSAHVVNQAAELVSVAAKQPLHAAAAVSLPVDVAAERWCDALLGDAAGPVVFMAPTAGWGAKQWPAERFGEVARALHARGFRVLVNASPFGRDAVAEKAMTASDKTAELVPCTLPQMIALLRRARLMIAGDTGPLHAAAALRVPVVTLFGPTDPLRNGPYGTRSVVLRHATSRTDHSRHCDTEAGLMAISVNEVTAAALQLLHVPEQAAAVKAY